MRQRQPDGAKLKKTGRSRIKDAPRDVDVRNGVAIKKDGALMVIKDQGANRKYGGNCCEQKIITTRGGVHSITAAPQLPNYSITKLLNYQITQLPNYSITKLLNYQIFLG